MSPAETRTTMVRDHPAERIDGELEARLAAHGQTVEVEADSGATSTANWWAHETQQTRAGAHRKTKLAAALATQAHAAGARRACRRRPAGRPGRGDHRRDRRTARRPRPEDRDRRAGPVDRLRRRARREGVADPGETDPGRGRPEIGEAYEAKVLEREERDAEAAATFRMYEDGHGKWHGKFTLPTVQGAMLKKP